MSEYPILPQTSQQLDTIDLSLCLFIYEVCNDHQFVSMSGSDFVNFINLKTEPPQDVVRSGEKRRVCYLTFALSMAIKGSEVSNKWVESFLQTCGISQDYYIKHRNDVRAKDATDLNQDFCKSVTAAIANAKKLRNGFL